MSKYTILVIEDNEDINFLTKTTLNVKGYNVLSSLNGKDGIRLACNNKVDLIILDVMMPDMDGYEVLKELKNNSQTANIPVAFFSAKTQKEEISKGFELGAIKYIKKPFDPLDLIKEVENILK